MSYYGKKAQVRSGKSDKSANSDFQKGKIVNDRRRRDRIREDYLKDDYLKDDYIKHDYLANEKDIETVSTTKLVELNNTALRYRYEGPTEEFSYEKQQRFRTVKKKNDRFREEYYKKYRTTQETTYNNIGNTGKNASNNVSGYIGSANEIKDAVTPEALKLQNYSAKKNYQRYKENQNKENGNVDPADDAISKTGSYISATGNRISKAWIAIGKILWRANWIAGLVYTFVTIIIILAILIVLLLSIPSGSLPDWAYSSAPTVKVMMANYEYIWDAAVYEVGNKIEKSNSISIPIDPTEDNVKLGKSLNGSKYINWRQVLAVYYAGMQSKANSKRTPEDDLVDFDSNDKALNTVSSAKKSYFNVVFWTMHDIMPVKDFTYNDATLKNYVSNKKINSYCFTVCYKPSLNVVMARLGFDSKQQSMVLSFLTEEFDEYFNEIINDRYISASQAVAKFAANEIDNVGTKYNKWYGAAQGTSWCEIFVEYVLTKSGYGKFVSRAGGVTSAYNYYVHSKNAKIHVVEGKSKDNLGVIPQPGWLVIFEWGDNDKYRDHIGIVESYNATTGIVTTIEGNTWTGTRQANSRTKVCRLHRRITSSTKGHHIYAFIELAYPKKLQNASARKSSIATNRYKEATHYTKICNSASAFLKNNPEVMGAMQYSIKYLVLGLPEWFITDTNPDTHNRALNAIINVYAGNHGKPKAQWKHPSEISLGIKNYDKSPYILDTSYYNLLANYYKTKMR